jgi:tRNA pseudouridine38-40 synthase
MQPNAITVQEVLDKVLSVLTNEQICTTGCGRTDSGVHAKNFFAHFDCSIPGLHDNSKFIYKINCLLPNDISVYCIYSVPSTAHARFDAISRTYLYRITRVKDPFNKEFSSYYSKYLDLEKMNMASELLLEFSDFTSFCKMHSDVKTNFCKIFSANWQNHQNELHFTISADRFLRNMVRAIVGSIIDVGRDRISPEDFSNIIRNKDRSSAGSSAPAKGLHLIEIIYPKSLNLHLTQF